MRSRKVTSEDKQKILSLALNKTKYKVIAKSFNVSLSCVKSIMSRDAKSQGLPPKIKVIKRITDGRVGTRLKEIMKTHPKMSHRDMPAELRKSLTPGVRIPSASTCRLFLKRNGFKVVKLSKKPLISGVNMSKRLDFAQNHSTNNDEWFDRIIWSDETTVRQCPQGKEQHQWAHINVKKENLPTNLQIHSGGFSAMFWGCFSSFGTGPLVSIEGSMNANTYIEVLEEHLMSEIKVAKDDFGVDMIFMQDNAPCHTAKSVQDFFDDWGVELLKWPAQSPDLNPIENLWAIVKRRRQKKFGVPKTRDGLIEQVLDIWDDIDVEECKNLSESVKRRFAMCIERKGKATKY